MEKMESQTTGTLAVVLDRYSRTPIYEQVTEQLKKQILTGMLGADDPLPSVRSLSVELGVNPNTLQKAYAELDRADLTYTVAGNGRFVHPKAKETLQQSEAEELYTSLNEVLKRLRTAGQSNDQIMQKTTDFLQGTCQRNDK